jgi:hypothetical protein
MILSYLLETYTSQIAQEVVSLRFGILEDNLINLVVLDLGVYYGLSGIFKECILRREANQLRKETIVVNFLRVAREYRVSACQLEDEVKSAGKKLWSTAYDVAAYNRSLSEFVGRGDRFRRIGADLGYSSKRPLLFLLREVLVTGLSEDLVRLLMDEFLALLCLTLEYDSVWMSNVWGTIYPTGWRPLQDTASMVRLCSAARLKLMDATIGLQRVSQLHPSIIVVFGPTIATAKLPPISCDEVQIRRLEALSIYVRTSYMSPVLGDIFALLDFQKNYVEFLFHQWEAENLQAEKTFSYSTPSIFIIERLGLEKACLGPTRYQLQRCRRRSEFMLDCCKLGTLV